MVVVVERMRRDVRRWMLTRIATVVTMSTKYDHTKTVNTPSKTEQPRQANQATIDYSVQARSDQPWQLKTRRKTASYRIAWHCVTPVHRHQSDLRCTVPQYSTTVPVLHLWNPLPLIRVSTGPLRSSYRTVRTHSTWLSPCPGVSLLYADPMNRYCRRWELHKRSASCQSAITAPTL